WAHRFYFALNDMKLGLPQKPLSILCYGGAIVGTIATVWVLLLL
ncbi:MAG: fumarate reductase subunit FrdD, partial [Candidatus Binatia bacterium]